MPIRVNLKEIFPSDPQEINVDKVNFNFNKLLELGVGSTGPIGLTGPQGPAGPIGLTGPQGDRGATWWVDAGNPNTLTFTGLVDGDMYLDQTSNTFEVYQYDELTTTWNSVVSIAATVNAYLSTVTDSPFERSLEPSTNNQFIVFKDRTDTNDGVRGSLNPSSNGILFLNNFDELSKVSQNQYNSLLGIFATHDNLPLPSTKIDLGRYHFEFGSLYTNGTTTQISELKHNLKGKFYKKYTATPELASTNEWINVSKFSLSVPEGDVVSNVDQNGEFEFVIPKYNNEGSPLTEEIYVRLGSAESFTEQTNRANVLGDGISITNNQTSRSMVMGLREDLGSILNLPYSSTNFALFDVSDDVDGLFFNKTLIQTGGNIEQIITTELQILDDQSFYPGSVSSHYMNQGIFIGENTIIVSSGAGDTVSNLSSGAISKFDISNPDKPVVVTGISGNRSVALSVGIQYADQHGHNYAYSNNPTLPPVGLPQKIGLVKDVYEYGKYIAAVLAESNGTTSNLVICETDSQMNKLLVTSYNTMPSIDNAYRIQVHGKYAWVITNNTVVTGPQSSLGTPTYGSLTAIDISNPSSPIEVDSYTDSQPGSKYLDFKIFDNKAYVLRYTNYVDVSIPGDSLHSLDLLIFDISDPYNFSSIEYDEFSFSIPGLDTVSYAPMDIENLETLTVNTTRTEYGSISVKGKDVYVAWEDNLYIIQNTITTVLSSTTQLSADPVYANDVITRGRYTYVLVNYTDSTGAVQIYDTSDITAPLFVSETRNSSLNNSSRLGINGKNIYVVSTQNGSRSRLLTLDLTGISAPSATIGSLRSDDINISGNANIKNNLHVKNSINVGPGGIFVDKGQGISSDGPISSQLSINMRTNNISGGLSSMLQGITQSGTSFSVNVMNSASLYNNKEFTDKVIMHYDSLVSNSSTDLLNGLTHRQVFRLGGTFNYGSSGSPLTTAFTADLLSLGSLATDHLYGDFIGKSIILASGVNMHGNDVYGYRFNFTGTNPGAVYGLYLTGTDKHLLEGTTIIDDVLQLNPRASAPSPASNGMIYYNSGTDKLMLYAGGAWVALN